MNKSRDSHIVVSKQFNLLKNPRTNFRVEEHFNFIGKFGRNRRMRRFDLINGSDCMSFGESTSLSCVRSIHDEVSRFCHVTREEEASFDDVRSMFIRRSR